MAATPSGTPRRSRGVAALVAVVVAVASLTATSSAPAEASAGEFVARINGTRASRGLAPLQVSGELTAQAQAWAQHMASVGQISHSGNLASGISANWTKLGENVGVGGTVDALHNAFVASPGHLRNIVDPAYSYVGVGVAYANGMIYTAHRFMAVAGSGSSSPPPPSGSSRSGSSGSSSSGGGSRGSSSSGGSTYGGVPEAPPPPPPPPPPPVPDPLAALPEVLAQLRLVDARS